MKSKKNKIMTLNLLVIAAVFGIMTTACDSKEVITTSDTTEVKFLITDTQQDACYDNDGNLMTFSMPGEALFGQDAQHNGTIPSFTNNGNGTVTDNITGLMWQKTPDTKTYSWDEAQDYAENLEIGGYSDWRLATIKELYSLADFRGELIPQGSSTPYIDTEFFDFEYPNNGYAGQYWSSTMYKVTPELPMEDDEKVFGFNFADGHIKSYPTGYNVNGNRQGPMIGNYVRCVRGEENIYGVNNFKDNGDNTVSDLATGLMWQQTDDGEKRNWGDALKYAENLELAGHTDWRLPNVKELESIVQYGKTTIPAIDENYFTLSTPDCYAWTSTTHGDFKNHACYVAFGKGWGIIVGSSYTDYVDVHGSGSQRTDPKDGIPSDNNQSSDNAADLARINNTVLCVRNITN
jgi:hypothetical protein